MWESRSWPGSGENCPDSRQCLSLRPHTDSRRGGVLSWGASPTTGLHPTSRPPKAPPPRAINTHSTGDTLSLEQKQLHVNRQLKRRCYCPQDTGRDPLRAPCSGLQERAAATTAATSRGPPPCGEDGLMGSHFRRLWSLPLRPAPLPHLLTRTLSRVLPTSDQSQCG